MHVASDAAPLSARIVHGRPVPTAALRSAPPPLPGGTNRSCRLAFRAHRGRRLLIAAYSAWMSRSACISTAPPAPLLDLCTGGGCRADFLPHNTGAFATPVPNAACRACWSHSSPLLVFGTASEVFQRTGTVGRPVEALSRGLDDALWVHIETIVDEPRKRRSAGGRRRQ